MLRYAPRAASAVGALTSGPRAAIGQFGPAVSSRGMATKRINYFNTLPLKDKLDQLARCRFMGRNEFADGSKRILGLNIVIVGCGAQGLNQVRCSASSVPVGELAARNRPDWWMRRT